MKKKATICFIGFLKKCLNTQRPRTGRPFPAHGASGPQPSAAEPEQSGTHSDSLKTDDLFGHLGFIISEAFSTEEKS